MRIRVSSDRAAWEHKEDDVHCVFQFGLVLEMLDLAESVEYVYKRVALTSDFDYNLLISVKMR